MFRDNTHPTSTTAGSRLNSGGGMAEATLARLFEPYFTTKAKGTGIGLYICKAMLERDFGGSLSARNEGPGSAFTARLGLGGER